MSDVYEGSHRRPDGVEPAPVLAQAIEARQNRSGGPARTAREEATADAAQ